MNLCLSAILPRFAILSGGILEGLKNALIGCLESLYRGAIEIFITFSSFGDVFNETYNLMPTLVKVDGKWDVVEGLISPFLKVSASFGAALALIFMGAAMIDIYTQEKMSVETFAKPFLQYLITVALMTNVELIIAGFWNFGVLFQKEISNIKAEEIVNTIPINFSREANVGVIIGCFIGGILVFLICLILGLVVRICASIAHFSRLVESGIRAIGLPIAIGVATDSSFRQGALRYIKKFLAVSLQGGFFIAISLLYVSMSASVFAKTATDISGGTTLGTNVSGTVEEVFDETTGAVVKSISFVAGEIDAGTSLMADASPISLAGGVAGVVAQILTMIIPIIGLALACVVVLFKSGQICSDIVGA